MASTIRIKRSSVTGNPSILAAGELAYSALPDNGSNGGDRLYIGMGTETLGNAANRVVIGGKYFTDLVNAATNLNTVSTIVRRDASGNFTAGTITAALTGNSSSATQLASGRTISLTGDVTYTSGSFDGTANVTGTATLANTAVTAGSYGSSTAIPTFTVDSKGRLTAAGTATISTTLTLNAGGSTTANVVLGTDNLTFASTSGITTTISKTTTTATLTIGIDTTVATLTGSQTLTNKTINLANNTLTATSAQLAAAVTDETGTGSLVFANTPTLVTPILGVATATSITGTVGNLAITAFAGNNNVNLVPTGTGTVDVSGKRITGVAEPTQPTDAATKQYVDTIAEGLHIHEACNVATTNTLAVLSGGTVTYANGTLGVGATLTLSLGITTLDGITLANGMRILVKNEATTANNGIYVRTSATVLTRATDFDTAAEIAGGDFVFIEDGTVFNNTAFVQTEEVITVGTTPCLFQQFSGAGTFTAGAGLTINGNEFNVIGTTDRILVNADSVDISPNYVGQTSITTLGTIGTGIWSASTIAANRGGTGVANAAGSTITLGGALTTSGAFTTTLTTTANTTLTLPTTGTLLTTTGSGSSLTFGTGTLSLAGNVTHAGAFTTTLTTTANTSVTLPTTGTLATLAGTEALSNKTITASSFAGSVAATTLSASGLVTLTNVTDATTLGTAAVVLSGGLSVAKAMFIGTNITGAGAATSTLDGFNIDGGTY